MVSVGYLSGWSIASMRVSRFKNVDVQMMRALHKVAVQDGNEVAFPAALHPTQRLRHDGEGVGNAVLAHIAVSEFWPRNSAKPARRGYRGRASGWHPATAGSPALWPSGVVPVFFCHNHVAGDGQRGQSMDGVTVQRMLFHSSENLLRLYTARSSTRSSSLPYLGKSPTVSKVHRHAVLIAGSVLP